MANDELLSQQEIDALLDHSEAADASSDDEVTTRPYQLGREQGRSRGRLPTLEMIAERFARCLSDSLAELFGCSFEVGPASIATQNFGDFCQSAQLPVSLSVCTYEPLSGSGLLAIDAVLVHQWVDQYFGAGGNATQRQLQQFSPTELRVIERVRERLFRDWDDAWQDVLPIATTLTDVESNPHLLNNFAAGDLLTCVSFAIGFGDCGGTVTIGLPSKGLEEHRTLLDGPGQRDAKDLDSHWQPRLTQALLDAEVSLDCQIATANVQVGDLLKLQVGDVLQASVPENHHAYVENVPLFTGKLGEAAGKLALEVKSTRLLGDRP